jgi:hypothetical protein
MLLIWNETGAEERPLEAADDEGAREQPIAEEKERGRVQREGQMISTQADTDR